MTASRFPALFAALLIFSSPAVTRADLVAHYGLDETSGTTVIDSLGENDGQLIGSGSTKGIPAPHGTAHDFPLRGGIDLGASLQVQPTDQFTLTWWMRPDTLNAFDRIYESLSGTGNSGNGIRIDLGGSGNRLRALLRDGNGNTNTTLNHPLTLKNDGTWYFCAVRYDSTLGNGSALKITVLEQNGTATQAHITSATSNAASLGTGPITTHNTGVFIAADDGNAATSDDFGGALDDLAFFQTGDTFGILTDAQLASVHNIGALAFDPPEPKPEITTFTASPDSISSGNSSTLSWSVTDTITLTLNPGNLDVTGTTTLNVSPTITTLYTLTATNPEGSVTATAQVTVDGQLLPPVLNEFLASNDGPLLDGDGDSSDWIEIHNPNLDPLDISGYRLTDEASLPAKYIFPAGTILDPDEYFIVFASGKNFTDGSGNLHTNFSLRSSGEYLTLRNAGGVLITEFSPAYPAQETGVSYSSSGYHLEPTPAAVNNDGFAGFVADTTFSHDRGFYTAPFSVTISSATTNAAIYYTTDGTEPSPANGTLYTAPVPVTTTTTLRAAAFLADHAPTNIDTHTYLFLNDVINQPNSYPGYPTSWAGRTADYEMDPTSSPTRLIPPTSSPPCNFSHPFHRHRSRFPLRSARHLRKSTQPGRRLGTRHLRRTHHPRRLRTRLPDRCRHPRPGRLQPQPRHPQAFPLPPLPQTIRLRKLNYPLFEKVALCSMNPPRNSITSISVRDTITAGSTATTTSHAKPNTTATNSPTTSF